MNATDLASSLRAVGQILLPCGHRFGDLIGGTEPDGRPSVTKCGACLATRQQETGARNAAHRKLYDACREITRPSNKMERQLERLVESLDPHRWPEGIRVNAELVAIVTRACDAAARICEARADEARTIRQALHVLGEIPATLEQTEPCNICKAPTPLSGLCPDGNCRACHKSLTFEECCDGSWARGLRKAAGLLVDDGAPAPVAPEGGS